MLVCTYACNVATPRERIEASVLQMLLTLFTPRTLANLIVRSSKSKPGGEIGLNQTQVVWLRALIGTNRAAPIRAAARGLITFDSRPWLGEIRVPTVASVGHTIPESRNTTLMHS